MKGKIYQSSSDLFKLSLFLWTLESFQINCMEEIALKKRLLLVKWHDFQSVKNGHF